MKLRLVTIIDCRVYFTLLVSHFLKPNFLWVDSEIFQSGFDSISTQGIDIHNQIRTRISDKLK
jgi:hypothetical protein